MSSRLVAEHTAVAWRWRWQQRPGLEVALEWVHGREKWLRTTRVDGGGWSPSQLVELDAPFGEQDAEAIAERHAAGLTTG